MAHPGDVGSVLADRIALLDRPAFASFFDTSGSTRPFSLKALDHPVRVRIDLPQRGHADASRILARLVLAQFTAAVAVREDRSLFACLILDDATGVVTPEAVRGIQRLRSANAGAVLTLRTLDDVPRPLRGPLLGTVGCRMALSGLTPGTGRTSPRCGARSGPRPGTSPTGRSSRRPRPARRSTWCAGSSPARRPPPAPSPSAK